MVGCCQTSQRTTIADFEELGVKGAAVKKGIAQRIVLQDVSM
jgi:hypothetical protein